MPLKVHPDRRDMSLPKKCFAKKKKFCCGACGDYGCRTIGMGSKIGCRTIGMGSKIECGCCCSTKHKAQYTCIFGWHRTQGKSKNAPPTAGTSTAWTEFRRSARRGISQPGAPPSQSPPQSTPKPPRGTRVHEDSSEPKKI